MPRSTTAAPLLAHLKSRTDAMVERVGALVDIESPSADVAAVSSAAAATAALVHDLLGGEAEQIEVGGRPHLRCRFGATTQVVVVGHVDTVWPLGTLARWPFSADDERMTGPGVFDMKAGLVQGLFGLAALDDIDGVTLVFNTDEETGSTTSRALIEEAAGGAIAALVLEPSADGAVKIGRKGVGMYDLEIGGRAAHAGLEPEKGVNATVELSHQVLAMDDLARPAEGTTVTPTVATAGTVGNTVPAAARVHVDVRATSGAELQRVDHALRGLRPVLDGASLDWSGGINRPPLDQALAVDLYARARRLAGDLGLGALEGVTVGGGSDGNFTAGIGVPTLDGLGAVGDKAHAEGEWASVPAMAERAALFALLVDDLLRG